MDIDKLKQFVKDQEQNSIRRWKKTENRKSELLNIGMEIAYSTVLEYLDQEDDVTDWASVLEDIEHKETVIRDNKIVSTYGRKDK